MSKGKTGLSILILFCLMLLLVYISGFSNQSALAPPEDISSDDIVSPSVEEHGGQLFVVPEVPLGTLGAISALAAACGLFVLAKKKPSF